MTSIVDEIAEYLNTVFLIRFEKLSQTNIYYKTLSLSHLDFESI